MALSLLATDLDGTFLGGRQADRLRLYQALADTPSVQLAFVTGRGVESVIPLLNDPLIPSPDFIIADVGATVVRGEGLSPVLGIQSEIEAAWIGVEAVNAALHDVSGLERQSVPQERRCSFFLDDPAFLPEIEERLAHLPCEVLFSADRYLDVLPKGVSKGSTLRKLVEYLGIDDKNVLVAGDTLNDYSLYTQGFPGVVVGRAEAALRHATEGSPNVVQATGPGASGILQAIETMNYPLRIEANPPKVPSGDAQLVVVYHRLPFEESVIKGRLVRQPHKSPNGIIPTLLGAFHGGRRGSWVAWSTAGVGTDLWSASEPVDERLYPHLAVTKVPLTNEDIQRFYKRFSKEAFWPVIFSFVERAAFSYTDWEHFVCINRLFAEKAATEADTGALAWIHDYNLWMVPAFLRQLRPDLRIGFFHHTPFPSADIFNIIPWADQLVGSLAQCDYIGFHIPRYAANFVDVLQSHTQTEVLETAPCAPRFRVHGLALGLTEMPTWVRSGERTILLGAHPVGVNVKLIREILATDKAREYRARIRERFSGTKVVLSVERLDYVKGIIQKAEAFENLLAAHPELRGQVTLVLVATPPADGMEVYGETREAVEAVVGRVNGQFRTLEWTPIHYLFRALPFEEVMIYNAIADVAWITPLRDGLNLVAKEYVVSQDAVGGAGVLVLSEYAGAAVELHGALLTNPYDFEGLSDGLHRALELSEEERRQRLRRLALTVEQYDVGEWTREVLGAMEDPDATSPPDASRTLDRDPATD